MMQTEQPGNTQAVAALQPDERPEYQLSTAAVLDRLKADEQRGLSADEARRRLERYGPNELPHEPPVPAWRRFVNQLNNPLTILLLAATAFSFVAWLIERDTALPLETITILAIVVLNAVLGYVQENRAERAVEALQAMSAPQARVLRDGEPRTMAAAELVPGDILLIEEGDTIPGDARVLQSISMRLGESALTGESAPVSKDSAPIEVEAGIGDRVNMLFSGTAVTSGRGRAIVTATGAATELGKIAGTLQRTHAEPTPLQKELDSVGGTLGKIVIVIAIVVAITIILVSGSLTAASFLEVILLAVSLAVAAVPEGLTAITTIVLSLGMQRMARRNVIVRKLNAVETLGSTTVICSDKTGTLTKNEMTVRSVVTHAGRVDLTGVGYGPQGDAVADGRTLVDRDDILRLSVRRVLLMASLANNARLVQQDGRWAIQGDPTEGALIVAARKLDVTEAELNQRFTRLGEVPFSSGRKMMSTAHEDANRNRVVLASKGAPDILLSRCTHERIDHEHVPLTAARRAEIQDSIDGLARGALRTLGVAYRAVNRDELTGELDEEHEHDFVWLGVVGMIDPPRDEARPAVAASVVAGVRPVMITGDHPDTAAAVARELGMLAQGKNAVTGAELGRMDDTTLQTVAKSASVYARVSPEHKLRIVQALKADGEVVAMTGDGVNDAPALKTADIGVAMGITGTDVSKGAADMILTDDNFASIVAAVEEGRSIFANIQKFLRYLLSSNIGEVMVMFLGVLLSGLIGLSGGSEHALVVPLLSTQILWINLLTDAGPALALGLEPADPNVMQRPPRDPRKRVIDGPMWLDIAFVGMVMAIGTLGVMDLSLPGGQIGPVGGTVRYAQTMAFTTLVFFQLFNVFNSRNDRESAFRGLFSNPWIWFAVGVSALLQVAVIYLPFLQTAFGTVPLSASDWLVSISVASSVLWAREIVKFVGRVRRRARQTA